MQQDLLSNNYTVLVTKAMCEDANVINTVSIPTEAMKDYETDAPDSPIRPCCLPEIQMLGVPKLLGGLVVLTPKKAGSSSTAGSHSTQDSPKNEDLYIGFREAFDRANSDIDLRQQIKDTSIYYKSQRGYQEENHRNILMSTSNIVNPSFLSVSDDRCPYSGFGCKSILKLQKIPSAQDVEDSNSRNAEARTPPRRVSFSQVKKVILYDRESEK